MNTNSQESRYIDVTIGGNTEYSVPSLYQYDKGISLRLFNMGRQDGINVQGHFSVSGATRSLNIQPEYIKKDGSYVVNVPDVLLMQTYPLAVYIYYESSQYGRTIYKITIPIIERAKPSNVEYTQEELDQYNALFSQIESYMESKTLEIEKNAADSMHWATESQASAIKAKAHEKTAKVHEDQAHEDARLAQAYAAYCRDAYSAHGFFHLEIVDGNLQYYRTDNSNEILFALAGGNSENDIYDPDGDDGRLYEDEDPINIEDGVISTEGGLPKFERGHLYVKFYYE